MIRVTAHARLHFGLLHPAPDDAPPARWPDRDGRLSLPARRFGGVGLMIESPALRLSVTDSPTWSAEGPGSERALTFALRFAGAAPDTVRPQRIAVEVMPPEHSGLGSGTQLGLAVARALTITWQLPELNAVELARRAGRGLRSAIGVHGFERGGFLVDGGKGESDAVAPLLVRREFPDRWRVILVLPAAPTGLHGEREQQSFRALSGGKAEVARTEALCRLVLLGMLPALEAGDLQAFGEALFDYNARAGEAFVALQGGVYASPAVAEVIAFLRSRGVAGVGQSSWGPAVFAVVDADCAEEVARLVPERFETAQVIVTRACNRGAIVTTD